MPSLPPENDPSAGVRARQRRTIQALALLLMSVGMAVLLFLSRVPLPMRLIIGFMDVFAGLGLLVLVRQKFKR